MLLVSIHQVSVLDYTNLLDYVDPFIGTGGDGHTFPGAMAPFGKVQPSPDNGESGWKWTSGYHISSHSIFGFSNTHLSGTGIPDLMDVSMMPFCLSHKEMGSHGFEAYLKKLLSVTRCPQLLALLHVKLYEFATALFVLFAMANRGWRLPASQSGVNRLE